MRVIRLIGVAMVLAAGLACTTNGKKGADVPEGTPGCEATCTAAWECNGVLGNDLANCIDQCVDDDFGEYRVCVNTSSCEEMISCKYLGPAIEGAGDTDN